MHWVDYVKSNLFGGSFHYGDMLDFLNARKPMIVVGQDYPCSQLVGIERRSGMPGFLSQSPGYQFR